MKVQNTDKKSFDLGKLGQELAGRKPTAIAMETIEVTITDGLIGDYARGFVQESYEKHPLRAERVGLTEAEMESYARFLLCRRVDIANGKAAEVSLLRNFWIPAFLQLCLENVGVIVDYARGLEIRPKFEGKVISKEEAELISKKVGAFSDVMVILQDAMPRRLTGNEQVMVTALIADCARSMVDVEPVYAYISAFLGLKLVQENLFANLYRYEFDSVKVIRTAFSLSRVMYQ